jgi:hypothetical protein
MTITNTQLAAALMSLGYELLPMDINVAEVVFDFVDESDVADYQMDWRELSSLPATTVIGDSPLEIMFRMSKARQWLLKQVIHGHHNDGITLPEKTLATSDLHLTVALVGNGCYLLKLDRDNRLFHFAESAKLEKARYELPSEWYCHARNYLVTLDQLVRLINNRNLTGQQRANAITSNKPYPTKQLSKYARA